MKIRRFIKYHKLELSFFVFLFSFSLFLMLFLRMDIDYFWHYKAGEYMVQHSTILTQDVFSWSLFHSPWVSHEWLFEILLYGLDYLFGDFHLFIYVFSVSFGLLLFLFFIQKREYLKNVPFALLWTIFFSLIFTGLSGRPQLLSFLFLAISVWLVFDFFYYPNSKKIYFLPFVSLLWANIHGGSSNLPYLLCFFAIFAGLFQFSCRKIEAVRLTRSQIITYLVVALLCMLGILFNPHGITMLFYPYQNMGDSLMLSTIAEWQPSNLNELSHYVYFIFVFFVLVVMIFSKKKIRFIDALFYIVFLYLGLKSIRFWFFSYIVFSFFIFYYISERKQDCYSCFLILMFSFLLFLFFVHSFSYSSIITTKTLSDEAITVLEKEKPKRLFNYYDYGAYLIYRDIPVFIDGRADLYSGKIYRDYQDISRLRYRFTNLLSKYQFDYFIVPKKSGIFSYLKNSHVYHMIYSDDTCVIFKQNKST